MKVCRVSAYYTKGTGIVEKLHPDLDSVPEEKRTPQKWLIGKTGPQDLKYYWPD